MVKSPLVMLALRWEEGCRTGCTSLCGCWPVKDGIGRLQLRPPGPGEEVQNTMHALYSTLIIKHHLVLESSVMGISPKGTIASLIYPWQKSVSQILRLLIRCPRPYENLWIPHAVPGIGAAEPPIGSPPGQIIRDGACTGMLGTG